MYQNKFQNNTKRLSIRRPVWIGVSTCLIAGLMIAPMRLNAESPTREPLPHHKFEGFPHSMGSTPHSPNSKVVFGGADAWVAKLDQNQKKVWMKHLGTTDDDLTDGHIYSNSLQQRDSGRGGDRSNP
ncbi:MAG: hypothetical protein WCD18_13680 [Thermosynechococcaceae cyanobacterium]